MEDMTVEAMRAKPILTIREAAKAFSMPEFALRSWCKRGELRHIKAGNRVYLTAQAIEEFIGGAAKQ
jgi:excisionase family DNA binding protein